MVYNYVRKLIDLFGDRVRTCRGSRMQCPNRYKAENVKAMVRIAIYVSTPPYPKGQEVDQRYWKKR